MPYQQLQRFSFCDQETAIAVHTLVESCVEGKEKLQLQAYSTITKKERLTSWYG